MRYAKAVLLVDDRQRQVFEFHFVLNDGVGADHQARFAALDERQHLAPLFGFLAAGEPRGFHTQRLQPGYEFAKVLLGQDLGGRHQGALPAGVDAHRCCQRGDHGFAAAHIALQQAVHRNGLGDVAGNLGAHPLLRRREFEGQCGQKPVVEAGFFGLGQGWRAQQIARAFALQLRELLGQQLFEFEPLPGRMAVIRQRWQGNVRCRVVQKR